MSKLIFIHVQHANKIACARFRKYTHTLPCVNEPKSIISYLISYLKYFEIFICFAQKHFFHWCYWWCLFVCVCLFVSLFYVCSFANFSSSDCCCFCCYYWCFPSAAFFIAFSSWLCQMIFATVNCYSLHSVAPIPVIPTTSAHTTTTPRGLVDKSTVKSIRLIKKSDWIFNRIHSETAHKTFTQIHTKKCTWNNST